jgi:hypothetical protein
VKGNAFPCKTGYSKVNKLFESLTTADIIGIIGIGFTIAVGFLIFFLQRRADHSINDLTKELHQMVHREDDRKKSIKRYYIRRIDSDYKLINKEYQNLKQELTKYLGNKSDERSWFHFNNFIENQFIRWVKSFVTVTDDIKHIVPFLDNPRLIDKYGLITFYGNQLQGYAKELTDRSRDNNNIRQIEKEINDIMNRINEFWDLLLKEVDHKL